MGVAEGGGPSRAGEARPAEAQAQDARSAGKDRTQRSLRDLILSLLVVGAFVVFLFVIVARPQPDAVRVVDPAPTVELARQQADFNVLAPVGLSEQWRATSARFDATDAGATELFLGYVTPEGQYVAMAQSDAAPEAFIAARTVDGQEDGQVQVADVQWTRYSADNGHRSLVRRDGDVTTVVTGTVSYEELSAFAERLRTA